jgi:predicted nucleic acid-binding protein
MTALPTSSLLNVVDASVAIKWLTAESGHQRARELLKSYVWGSVELIAPSVLKLEVASALSKQVRRRQMTTDQAKRAFVQFQSYRPQFLDHASLAHEALDLSTFHHLSLWDCLYLAQAIRYRCGLITADRQFYRVAKQHYPFMTLLGA